MMKQKDSNVEKGKAWGKFSYNKFQMGFHFIFISIMLSYVLWRIPNIALEYPDYQAKQSFLSDFIGFKRDSHDDQWQSYRNNLPILISVICGWQIVTRFLSLNKRSTLLGLIICLFSFRIDSLFYFSIVSFWFLFTKLFYKKKFIIGFSWIFTILILFANEKYDHFRPISAYVDSLIPDALSFIKSSSAPIHWAHIFNMSLLRLISFTVDNYRQSEEVQLQKHKRKCSQCSEKELCQKGRDFSALPPLKFSYFINYLLFAPTFLTGPPTSYKNYHSFSEMPTSVRPSYMRWILVVLSFQIYQHLYPVIHPQEDHSLIDVELLSLFNLVFIWYKFLIVWKTARMWALMCGVDVIDNMSRCLFNNYCFEGFWRMWHRGFNHWLIRYLYIPTGGNKNYLSVVLVIAFVAFWHDHTINIVVWAFILVLFMVPEIAAKRYFNKYFRHLYHKYWFKYFCSLVCAIYIYLICLANLVGFGYGYEKANILFQKIFIQWQSAIISVFILASAVNIMFYIRHLQGNSKNY